MQRKNLYIVDGNSYCYRAYYAVSGLTTSDGRPSGAVYGFINMLNKLKSTVKPDYLAICFDLKGPTHRHEKFEDYKAQRKPMPDDLISQMGLIKEVISAYGIPIFEIEGYEADDLIASLVMRFKQEVDVYIVTGDKDMMQLVDKDVKIYNPQKDDAVIDEKRVFERFSVTPCQIIDLLALAGDSADNIPGVPGIGMKTAVDLIGKFGSFEGVFKNLDQITQKKRRESLTDFEEQARLSRELATLITDVDIVDALDELKVQDQDTETLIRIFQDLEFRNLLKGLSNKPPVVSAEISIDIIETPEALKRLGRKLKKLKECSICIGPDSEVVNGICCIDIAQDQTRMYRIKIGSKITLETIKKELSGFFSDQNMLTIGYDLKTVCLMLGQHGIYLNGPFFDVMVAAYLLEPNLGTLSIEEVARVFLNRNINKDVQAIEQMCIKDETAKLINDNWLGELFFDVEMPLVRVLASMQQAGIEVDEKLLLATGSKIDKKLTALIEKIYKISGCEFNINSTKQLREVLFEKLQLPVIKKGKTGPSTDADVLLTLANQHALPAVLLEYRELTKLKSTYIDGMLALIDKQTKRVYTSFNQTVTTTGRLSSSAPNLQNIPIKTESGRQIRAVFVACSGRQLLAADYSQIELRVLAHLSKDKHLIEAFKQDLDIHAFTASLIFGVEENTVTKKMRDIAKRVNFGIVYGMGAFGLAKDIGVSHDEAKKFISEYFNRYPLVKTYMQEQIDHARDKGYVTTLLNRRRYMPQITSKLAMQRSFAERTAMNTPIQGTAADLIKAAMVEVYRVFKAKKLKSVMLLQVHDELVFEVPKDEMEMVKRIVKDIMENVLRLDVPIKVSLKVGQNWKDMELIEGERG
ncbi:MAG: DNA polymerase I [PVC group bacterium]|nr:DNA polymerase I [PVC group bacterium]